MTNNRKILNRLFKSIDLSISNLQLCKNIVDTAFVDFIYNLSKIEGNLVLTGIGKSAIIAQKATATLNSTGTKALYFHATDALHGDIGSLNNNDILCLISKSGKSKEILDLAKVAKNKNVKIVALINKENEQLKKIVDYYFVFPVDKEACIHNLAPTTSSAVQMVVLDSIAVALQELNNFESDDFAKLHPAGVLGKKLIVKVADLVCANFPVVDLNDDLKKVIYTISKNRIGATAVKEDEKIIGIITDGDLRRMLEKEDNFIDLHAQQIMTSNPKKISKDNLASEALNIMKENKITQLLVFDSDSVIGFIHIQDVLNEGID